MIYIIGGLPRTGKTVISKILINQLDAFAIDTDQIRAMFGAEIASPIAFTKSTDIFLATIAVSPYINAFIKSSLGGYGNQIISGEALDPIPLSQYGKTCKICFLGISNIDRQFDRIRNHAPKGDWTNTLNDKELRDLLRKYQKRSEMLKDECLISGLTYFDVTEVEFLTTVQKIIDFLTDKKIPKAVIAQRIDTARKLPEGKAKKIIVTNQIG